MSYSIYAYGMNTVAEVKAYNLDFSTTLFLSSLLRQPGDVVICTYSLPAVNAIYPAGLNIRTEGVTIIAHTNYLEQAKALKQRYPALRIYLNNRAHAKMILTHDRLWVGSANLTKCHSMEGTLAIASPAICAFMMDELRRNGAFEPGNEVVVSSSGRKPPWRGI